MDSQARKNISRRSVFRAATGAAAVLAGGSVLQACGSQEPAQSAGVKFTDTASGDVKYLCWEGYADQSFVGDYQGPKIVPSYYGSFDEMFGKLRSGGGAAYDAVTTASDIVIPLAKAGNLAPIDVSSMPNYKNLRPQLQKSEMWMHNGEQYAVPIDWGSTVFLVNDQTLGKMDETLPFELLFDPKLRNRVTAMDDLSVIYTAAVYLGYKKFWDLTDQELAEVQKLLVDKLLPNVRKFSLTFADQANLFANKEVDLAWGWTGVIKAALLAVNADYVSEHQITPTMPWYVDTISAVAKTDNPEGVAHWINYNLDAKVSAARYKIMGLPTIIPSAAEHLTPDEQKLSYLTPDRESMWSNLDPDLQWHPVQRRSKYQDVWNSVKSGIRE